MARSGFPSMTALLGLLAVAGYQNRDKISEMLNSRGGAGGGTGGGGLGGAMGGGDGMGRQAGLGGGAGGLGGMLGGLMGGGAQGGAGGGGLDRLLGGLMGGASGAAGGAGLGGLLGGGLQEMNERFRQTGRGQVMDSWVNTGPNERIEPHDLEAAIGPETLEDLQEATGLSREELLSRLSRELPDAIDQYTPDGRLPDRDLS
ncbi:YidB family protein [Rubellimicrobium aerolatum]|uniref:YidB family protein n=1 Tax=Rubellimicrobium aerolatum TaxID=490979 RepID=A0ABW0S9T4_9RHOB|nr:YidB family protein [Rubellimicrobium aerolatum]MBP1805007.1 uncharacterized protein YidB (DUF937 family) [Rubellimicrobium aerolatum]